MDSTQAAKTASETLELGLAGSSLGIILVEETSGERERHNTTKHCNRITYKQRAEELGARAGF